MLSVVDIKQQLADQPWYYTALEAWLLYVVLSHLRTFMARKRLGAVYADWHGDWLYGFKIVYVMIQMRKLGTVNEYGRKRFLEFGKHTFGLRVAGSFSVITKEPENIKALLATQFNDFVLGSRHRHLDISLGDGIFTLDGPGWKHSRAMLRPQFSRDQVGHVAALEPRVRAFVANVNLHRGQTFDIQELFYRLTVDSASRFLFGELCDSLCEDLDENYQSAADGIDPELRKKFSSAFNYVQEMLNTRINLQVLYFLGNNRKFRECNKIVHEFTDYYVNKALNASEKQREEFGSEYVFLYELIKQTRDPKTLRDQALNIMVAGRDTTASLLSTTVFELARNPQIFQRLRKDVVEMFGEGDDCDLSLITFESLKKCEYLKWVLNESLRMYPAVPRNFRIATQDTTLPTGGGANHDSPVFVPKGTMVLYSVYATQRDEVHFGKDAMVYRPERWGEPSTKKLGWAFVPFNGGPRICLGQQFALTEASYVLVRILQQFKHLTTNDEIYPPKLNVHLTLSVMDGVNVSLW